MNDKEWLTGRFEANRPRLRALAYRLLGSLADADDAVQECWLRVSRAGAGGVENLDGWLTTVQARVCFNMLRARRLRREDLVDASVVDPVRSDDSTDPEQEALMAESVGIALMVVLERLSPAERVAFVLHDVFDVPFHDIGSVLERSPTAARQLASRARRRVRGPTTLPNATLVEQRAVVDAFLTALRAGDIEGVLAVLDPAVVRRADHVAMPSEAARVALGAATVAQETLAYKSLARFARPMLVDGAVGIVVAPRGRLWLAIRCTVQDAKIVEMEVIAEPARLQQLDLAVHGAC